ncbi:MAG TPA: ATP-binding protein [Bryobacteraceae bacterium]|nr:ATP-binding protein [Bryobacteraceae bacterium]
MAPEPAERFGVHSAGEPVPESRSRVLLVDDSPENLISLEAALEGLGADLVCAGSGMEALRHLLDEDFAAIILDVKMPDMDGFQTAEMIRSRKRSRHIPILFLTGYKSDEHLFRGYDLGAVDFLFKPVVPEILRSKVNVFVKLSRNTELLRQQAEALSKTEQKFRSLLEAAPDAMIISAEDGRITLVNSQAERLFGFRREELAGENIQTLLPEWKGLQTSAGSHKEVKGVRKDRSSFPAEISLSPLNTEEGLLVTSAIRDITERKKIDEAIRELNARLEERVTERTRELREANEALRQSNDDLSQFAYAASHDLQEPLRMVALYGQLFQKRYAHKLDEEAGRSLGFMITGAQRMEMLLRDLLVYSQTGSDEEPSGPVDCQEVLAKVALNLQAAIEQNKATVTWSRLPEVKAHEIRIVQLFQNLVGNAIKYRGAEPPVIKVSAEQQDGHWLFGVEDNGIGIKPEYSQQVFGIFKRLHGHSYPGTGIGLAICQRIVERYGGRIWVEPAIPQGSKFCFTMPRVAVDGRRSGESTGHEASRAPAAVGV